MDDKNKILVFALCFFSAFFVSFAGIPSYIHICHRNDPELNQCIIDSVDAIRPKLKEGIPELKVPPVEPLPLNKVQLKSGPNQAQIDADLNNLQIWGILGIQIKNLSFSVPKKLIETRVLVPAVYFEGDYDIDLNVMILKYKGQGVITGNLTNYILDGTLKYDLFQKGGKDYMNFPKLEIAITTGKSTMELQGLGGPESSTLEKGINEVLKDNTDLLVQQIKPALEEGLSVRLTEIANQVVHSFPYDELFPL